MDACRSAILTNVFRRWIESRDLATLEGPPSGEAVYRQPYNAVRETARCFSQCPDLAQHVRRLWFNGLYTAETNAEIFKILAQCRNLRSLTMPWVSLRYGTAERWRDLLREDGLESLELTAIDMTKSALSVPANQVDHRVLEDPGVSFRNLKKLKIFGNTNFRPITDDDLRLIARTATSLEALHVTGISSVSIAGKFLACCGFFCVTSNIVYRNHLPRRSFQFYPPCP